MSVSIKKSFAPPLHARPRTHLMVNASLKALNERNGSSMAAMKKYISAIYKLDAKKLSPYIKKYLLKSVISGKLIQTRGKDARGSFKLAVAAKKKPKQNVASARKFKKKFAATSKNQFKKPMAKPKKAAASKKAMKKKIEQAKVRELNNSRTVKAKPMYSSLAKAKPRKPTKPKTIIQLAEPKKEAEIKIKTETATATPKEPKAEPKTELVGGSKSKFYLETRAIIAVFSHIYKFILNFFR